MFKKIIKKIVPVAIIEKYYSKYNYNKVEKFDKKRFSKYSFGPVNNLDSFEQLEARITKEYHSLEKGFSYQELRYGFGKGVLDHLVYLLDIYNDKGYPKSSHAYQTALSNLYVYLEIHEENDHDVKALRAKVAQLGTSDNNDGGIRWESKDAITKHTKESFYTFSNSRHSVRDYSNEPVAIETLEEALNLAQNTPSACNRQPWKVRVVSNPKLKKVIQANQNGNRGFGDYIDKFLIITSDVQYYSKPRERKQAEIDGGMYAMNLLYSLHYYDIAAVPLSGSLSLKQEVNLRNAFEISESENFIMFIGIGNYVEDYKVPKSSRRKAEYKFFE